MILWGLGDAGPDGRVFVKHFYVTGICSKFECLGEVGRIAARDSPCIKAISGRCERNRMPTCLISSSFLATAGVPVEMPHFSG
jgi:hypothetical protein